MRRMIRFTTEDLTLPQIPKAEGKYFQGYVKSKSLSSKFIDSSNSFKSINSLCCILAHSISQGNIFFFKSLQCDHTHDMGWMMLVPWQFGSCILQVGDYNGKESRLTPLSSTRPLDKGCQSSWTKGKLPLPQCFQELTTARSHSSKALGLPAVLLCSSPHEGDSTAARQSRHSPAFPREYPL